MADKHYVIATQTGYLVDTVTGYPYEFASRQAAVKALAQEVKEAATACRRSYGSCSVVGSARSGSVQIRVGGRQGYNLWQRYIINERSGSRKPRKESSLLSGLRAASKPMHATMKDEPTTVTYLTTPIVEVRDDPPPRGSGMTREGYTKRSGAPTARMVRLQGEKRWRRLMVWQFSNLGTLFVRIDGKPHVVREEDIPRESTAGHATRKTKAQLDRDVHKALVLSLKPGAKIIANGYPGSVVRVTPYGMVEVRLPGGVAAVSPEDVQIR
ncbi:MAG TPA: hypothetical protein VLE97_07225 [Gaiellaceae bacterium]|nr:hypothetical protein [Gaiellaceae bacterium]